MPSTKKLTDELAQRKGVQSLIAEPYEQIKITVGQKEIVLTGPAVILINQD